MIELGTTDFFLDAPPLSPPDLEKRAVMLFDAWDTALSTLPLVDYALSFDLEEGSLKGKGRLYARGLLIVAILGKVDGAFGGLERITSAVKSKGKSLIEQVGVVVPEGKMKHYRVTAGQMQKVQSIIRLVKKGELTEDEGSEFIRTIFSDEQIAEEHELIDTLSHAVRQVPKDWKQQWLFDEDQLPEPEPTPRPPKKRIPRPTDIPLPEEREMFKVEVYRESKNGKRKVTVVELKA